MARNKNQPLVIQNILESRESFSSLLKFHHTTINDKIGVLKVVNDISHRGLEEHLESLKQKNANEDNPNIGVSYSRLNKCLCSDFFCS